MTPDYRIPGFRAHSRRSAGLHILDDAVAAHPIHDSPMFAGCHWRAASAFVDRMGWSCVVVRDAEPPFAYTVGLMHSYHHPELVILGRPEDDTAILSDLVAAIRQGTRIDRNREYDILDGFPVAARHVHETQHELYLGFAMGFVRQTGRIAELEAIQIFVPNIEGRYPFDSGCPLPVYLSQPRLDIPLTKSERNDWRRQ